ncbi:hypothetical protein [Floricoccus penangensis]|uniref:hypothetical protein n=1 Tax=Floricoccus penangensis TaxID=1859475 RepID=UPI00203CFCC8|nr:hypothetical protein [Floricoccus penangensis]URZ87084.1 hypothetical protein KIW23_08350 [Floricoccus penangensis]
MIEEIIFSRRDLEKFSLVSGDNNSVHDTGLVFGMLIMARIEGILSNKGIKFSEIEYRFLKPLYTEQTATLKIYDSKSFSLFLDAELIGEGEYND